WCVFAGLPLIAGPITIAPAGMLFIAAACAAVLLGAWIAGRRQHATMAAPFPPPEPPLLGWLIAVCTLLGLAVVVLILYSFETSKAPSVTVKRVVWLAGVVVVIAGGFVLIQMARYAGWSSGRPTAVVDSLWLNTLPYMGVFSGWLQRYGLWDSLHLTFGQYTFAGAFDLLHIHSR